MRMFQFQVSSSRNITFKYSETFTLEDMGFSEEEWQEMSEAEREQSVDEYAEELLFNQYVNFSAQEIEE